MTLKLKTFLKFRVPLVFGGFLPELETDKLHFSYNNNRFDIKIGLTNRAEHLAHVREIPQDPNELLSYATLFVTGLTIEIDVTNPDPEILIAQENFQETEKTREFGREIFNLLVKIHNAIVHYFRNEIGLFLIEYPNYNPKNYLHTFHLRWLNPEGNWRNFLISFDNTIHFSTTLPTRGINKQEWIALAPFIENNRKSSVRKVLLNNSRQYLSQNNARLAIINLIIAWENTLQNILPNKVIPSISLDTDLKIALRELVREGSLRRTSKIALRILKNELGLDDTDIENVIKGIQLRNDVVHSSRREENIDVDEVRSYINSINTIIHKFESVQ